MSLSSRSLAAAVLVLVVGAPVARATTTDPTDPTDTVTRGAVAPEGQVLAISVDALNPRALTRLGRDRLPHLWRLLDEGAGTLNARSQYELTLTLPNHTSMVTGRRIDARRGGHGVTWNDDRPGTTVQGAAGHAVSSVFGVVHDAGGSTAIFSTKTKLSLFNRSWDGDIDRSTIREEQDLSLVRAARADLVNRERTLTFLHLGLPDQIGHAQGFMSPAYLRAVERVDDLVGRMLRAIDNHPGLSDVVVVLTADHGGQGASHSDPTRVANYRVPFVVWGPGVQHGDLYAMNPTYVRPGSSRPDPVGAQPIRNGDLANLTTDLLGLGPVPGSLFDRDQRLVVSR